LSTKSGTFSSGEGRFLVHAGVIKKVEADLPKLLHGHNGRLLKSQQEIDAALARLKAVLETISQGLGTKNGFFPGDVPGDVWTYYTRIDLVWQFDLPPALVLLALRNAKHPEITKRTGEWQDQTLVFPGTKIRISMYDKKAKMRASCPHNVMRVEIQLHDEKIAEHIDFDGTVLKDLSFNAVYTAYRDSLLQFGFNRMPDPGARGTIKDYIAWAVTVLPDIDAVGMYCAIRKMCPRKARDLRKQVGLRVPKLVGFSWSTLLPADHTPPVVEIASPRKENAVRAFFEDLESGKP
jgi:hypothetical protein